ncbi:hypothetical protein BKA93DRAFT_729994 [Sparassis latifolia]
MDLPTLLLWQRLSKRRTILIHNEFSRTLIALLSPFIVNPRYFEACLVRTSSVISGYGAQWFIDRNMASFPTWLDICVPRTNMRMVHFCLMHRMRTTEIAVSSREEQQILARGCTSVTRLLTSRGFIINILCSASESALYPITHSWTTLLMNYVTPDNFGCAYPSLTLRNRGILVSRIFSEHEYIALTEYLARQYELGFHPLD